MYVNRMHAVGNLVRDPKIYDFKGISCAKFTVALNKPGQDSPIYLDCIAWRDTGTRVAEYCCKGQEIYVTGEIDISTYYDGEGIKRKNLSLVVREFSGGRIPKAEVQIKRPEIPMTQRKKDINSDI